MNNIYEDLNLRLLNVPNAYFETYNVESFFAHMVSIQMDPPLTAEQKLELYKSKTLEISSISAEEVLLSLKPIEFLTFTDLVDELQNLKKDILALLSSICGYVGHIKMTAIVLDPFDQLDKERDFVEIDLTISANFFHLLREEKVWTFKGVVTHNHFTIEFAPLLIDSLNLWVSGT